MYTMDNQASKGYYNMLVTANRIGIDLPGIQAKMTSGLFKLMGVDKTLDMQVVLKKDRSCRSMVSDHILYTASRKRRMQRSFCRLYLRHVRI